MFNLLLYKYLFYAEKCGAEEVGDVNFDTCSNYINLR